MFYGKGCMLLRLTVMMWVSIGEVVGNLRFFPGDLAIFGILFFAIVFAFWARTIVTLCTIAGFCSWG